MDEALMRDFRGTGHSRNGRTFAFEGEFHPDSDGLVWSADVYDRPGRSPLKLRGRLGRIFAEEDAERQVLEQLREEIAKRRL